MSDYNSAWSVLNSISQGDFIGDHLERMSIDQRLKTAEVLALLSISQELSGIRHAGINPEYDTSS